MNITQSIEFILGNGMIQSIKNNETCIRASLYMHAATAARPAGLLCHIDGFYPKKCQYNPDDLLAAVELLASIIKCTKITLEDASHIGIAGDIMDLTFLLKAVGRKG